MTQPGQESQQVRPDQPGTGQQPAPAPVQQPEPVQQPAPVQQQHAQVQQPEQTGGETSVEDSRASARNRLAQFRTKYQNRQSQAQPAQQAQPEQQDQPAQQQVQPAPQQQVQPAPQQRVQPQRPTSSPDQDQPDYPQPDPSYANQPEPSYSQQPEQFYEQSQQPVNGYADDQYYNDGGHYAEDTQYSGGDQFYDDGGQYDEVDQFYNDGMGVGPGQDTGLEQVDMFDGEEDHWDDVYEADTEDAEDLYRSEKPAFADLDAVDDAPDTHVENDDKPGGILGWLRRIVSREEDNSDKEQYIASINRKLRQPQVIGIMGSKGGVGKTSKSQVIGSILSHYRSEGGVVAVDLDANSTLIQRMKPQAPPGDNASVHTFAHDDTIHSAADVNSYLVLNEEKLAVLAGVGMTGSAPLRKDELQRVLQRLGEYYTLIILDFPGSAEVPVAMHALKVIDAMVYVAEITSSSLSSTKRDLRRIANVRPELLSTATIILNHRTAGKVHIKNLEGHVEDFRNMGTKDTATGASLVKVYETNFDPHIGIEGPIQISKLDPVNHTRYMQIAATIMDSLPGNTPGYMRFATQADRERVEREIAPQTGVIDP